MSHWERSTADPRRHTPRSAWVLLALAVISVVAAASVWSPSASATGAPVTLPDLTLIVPTNAISIADDPTSGDRELRFTHVTSDVGTGPFEIDPTYDPVTGISTFVQEIYDSPSSGVWHRDYTVPLAITGNWDSPSDYQFPLNEFTLNQVNADGSPGAVVATSPKTDFCMTGDTLLTGVPNTPNQTFIPQSNCTDPTKPLGWSVGWGDEYDQTDSGQPIDLTNVPDGTYILRGVVDPQHVLTESNTGNDVTDTTIQISGDSVTVLSQTNPGPTSPTGPTPPTSPGSPPPAASTDPAATPPTIRLTTPAAGARISGKVTLRAAASAVSPATVASVQFLLDGQPLGRRVTGLPYTYAWTIGSTPPGRDLLSARVTDSHGDLGTARAVPVEVVRQTSAKKAGAGGFDVRTLRWRRGLLTVVVSKLPKRSALSVKLELTGRAPRFLTSKDGRLRVRTARPAAVVLRALLGRRQLGKAITARLGEPPRVRITNPTAGETLSGTVPLAADASDDVAVSSVTFAVDGKRVGRPVTAPPWAIQWRTTGVPSGKHTISALATDPSGNTAKATVVVDVLNPAPTMTCFVQQADLNAHGRRVATTPAFHTAMSGEILLALVSADGPTGARRQSATVSGAGLRWRLVKRANESSGDSEIWAATARTILTHAKVTSVLANPAFDQSLSVVAMEGVGGVGSAAGGSGAKGVARVDLATRSATSLVFAVGNAWDQAVARVFPTGWVPLDQWLDTGAGNTFWSQSTNQPTGRARTTVAVKVAEPTSGQWNLAAVELTNDEDGS